MSRYSGKQKLEFCKDLGDDWLKLADYFEIPPAEQDCFRAEQQPHKKVWEWLEHRKRLAKLPEALRYIDREDMVEILEPVVPTLPPQQATWKESPYPGLRQFTEDEAPIFFGRKPEIQELLKRLADPANHFVAVIGASGSGKSSLVRAGVIPQLSEIPGGSDWLWKRFTPGGLGNDPFLALAVTLVDWLERQGWSQKKIAERLYASGELGELAETILASRPATAELLLFIDQFEELFTHAVPPEGQRRFIAMLAKAVEAPRVRLILTVRADFYQQCLDAGLDKLLRLGSYPLAGPERRPLLEMITGPVALAGLSFAAGLPERILTDTGREPGALALMAFALAELDKARTAEKMLTHQAYESFGRVQGAIARRAEDTFKELDEQLGGQAQTLLDEVFRELVGVGDRGVATRRRMKRSQVCRSPAAEQLVDCFTDARLLVTSDEGGQRSVEVAHEALLKSWPRLAEWIETVRDALRQRHQLQRAAIEWKEHGYSDAYRWSDERIVEAAGLLKRLSYKLDELEQRFLGPVDRERMLAELDDPTTSHEQRAIIGVRLALLGDPRPGVGLREDGLPDIVWCPVLGGEVMLERNAGTFSVEPFCIAKYPVTYIQYRVFLEAKGGFYNSAWWQGLPFRQPDEFGRQFNRRDNHPAENVAWDEAMAFCRWLSARLGYEIRLPTEWQWQQAATGGDSRHVYPWGPDWDSNRANTYESELSRSTAVGMYPHGASAVGALDMAGNVWEWCLNEYEKSEQVNLSSTANRVVRGGSWNNDQDNARAAYRNRNNPDNRNNNVGFRLVCASHILPPLQWRRSSGLVASVPTSEGLGSASGNGRRPRFAARGEGLKMAQVSPVRTESLKGSPSGLYKREASPGQCVLRRLNACSTPS
jgi:hypothetical protein